MTIRNSRRSLTIVSDPDPAPPKVSAARAEIDELIDAANAAAALRNAVRIRAEELVDQSLSWGSKLVFPRHIVEEVCAAGKTTSVLYLSSRPLLHKAHHYVINAQINGVKVRDATHWLLRDAAGRTCRVSRPGAKDGTYHRVFAFPANDETLVRIFAHEAGDGNLLKEKFGLIESGEVEWIDRDEYEDRLHERLVLRRESRY